MGSSTFGNYGVRAAIDNLTRFLKPGADNDVCFLRVKNFTEKGPVAQMGFTFSPTASGAFTGYTDYQIDPPPVIRMISMHNLGMAAQAGIQLRVGARDILISQTFVLAQMMFRKDGNGNPFTNFRQVFEDPSTLGIVANSGIIVSIESIMADLAYGQPATWTIRGNANEIR
jgi:hypothetical protein